MLVIFKASNHLCIIIYGTSLVKGFIQYIIGKNVYTISLSIPEVNFRLEEGML